MKGRDHNSFDLFRDDQGFEPPLLSALCCCLCSAVLCCVLLCVLLCSVVLCSVLVLCGIVQQLTCDGAVLCCAVLCCAVLCCDGLVCRLPSRRQQFDRPFKIKYFIPPPNRSPDSYLPVSHTVKQQPFSSISLLSALCLSVLLCYAMR